MQPNEAFQRLGFVPFTCVPLADHGAVRESITVDKICYKNPRAWYRDADGHYGHPGVIYEIDHDTAAALLAAGLWHPPILGQDGHMKPASDTFVHGSSFAVFVRALEEKGGANIQIIKEAAATGYCFGAVLARQRALGNRRPEHLIPTYDGANEIVVFNPDPNLPQGGIHTTALAAPQCGASNLAYSNIRTEQGSKKPLPNCETEDFVQVPQADRALVLRMLGNHLHTWDGNVWKHEEDGSRSAQTTITNHAVVGYARALLGVMSRALGFTKSIDTITLFDFVYYNDELCLNPSMLMHQFKHAILGNPGQDLTDLKGNKISAEPHDFISAQMQSKQPAAPTREKTREAFDLIYENLSHRVFEVLNIAAGRVLDKTSEIDCAWILNNYDDPALQDAFALLQREALISMQRVVIDSQIIWQTIGLMKQGASTFHEDVFEVCGKKTPGVYAFWVSDDGKETRVLCDDKNEPLRYLAVAPKINRKARDIEPGAILANPTYIGHRRSFLFGPKAYDGVQALNLNDAVVSVVDEGITDQLGIFNALMDRYLQAGAHHYVVESHSFERFAKARAEKLMNYPKTTWYNPFVAQTNTPSGSLRSEEHVPQIISALRQSAEERFAQCRQAAESRGPGAISELRDDHPDENWLRIESDRAKPSKGRTAEPVEKSA